VPVRATAPTADYLLTDKICDLREGSTASSLVAFSGYSSYSLADEISVHLVGGGEHEAVTPPLLTPGGDGEGEGGGGRHRDVLAQVATLDAPARDGRLSVANFVLRESVGGGKFGEVWRGLRVATGETIVLKRLLRSVDSSTASGYREAYFGDLLQGKPGVAPFLTHFVDAAGDLWLVFQDSGVSLYALLYARTRLGAGGYSLSPSEWWRTRLRAGGLKIVMIALLRALSTLHASGVVHRDVKPSNILINQTGSLVLCDFGSAVDDSSRLDVSLYPDGLHGRDETIDYQPPEVRLAEGPVPPERRASPAYDVWSAGIVAIELYLGTPSPLTALSGLEWHRSTFEFHSALGTKLRQSAQELEATEPARAARLFVASALADLCVLEACSDHSLATRLSVLDPLRRKPSLHFVRLVRAMLAVDPDDRATADEALELADLL
jgi:serine/threonine protein kinase